MGRHTEAFLRPLLVAYGSSKSLSSLVPPTLVRNLLLHPSQGFGTWHNQTASWSLGSGGPPVCLPSPRSASGCNLVISQMSAPYLFLHLCCCSLVCSHIKLPFRFNSSQVCYSQGVWIGWWLSCGILGVPAWICFSCVCEVGTEWDFGKLALLGWRFHKNTQFFPVFSNERG